MAFHPIRTCNAVDVNPVRDFHDREEKPIRLRIEDIPTELLLSQKRGFAHKLFDSPQVLIASFHCIAPCSKRRRKDNYPDRAFTFSGFRQGGSGDLGSAQRVLRVMDMAGELLRRSAPKLPLNSEYAPEPKTKKALKSLRLKGFLWLRR